MSTATPLPGSVDSFWAGGLGAGGLNVCTTVRAPAAAKAKQKLAKNKKSVYTREKNRSSFLFVKEERTNGLLFRVPEKDIPPLVEQKNALSRNHFTVTGSGRGFL